MDRRVANIVLLFKMGSRENAGNYRPVSFMSVVAKLLERILQDMMRSHLAMNSLLGTVSMALYTAGYVLLTQLSFF